MGLCGSFRCGCGVTSTPAVSGAIGGELPSIFVAGSGEPGDPYDLTLNDAWAAEVAEVADALALIDLGAWTSWTPVVTQSNTPTITNVRSRWARDGRKIAFSIHVELTSSGTASNAIVVSLPVEAASLTGLIGCGAGRFIDASATNKVHPFLLTNNGLSLTSFSLMDSTVSGTSPVVTLGNASSQFTAALATNDSIICNGVYEAAS
jgi:hypothetical protein